MPWQCKSCDTQVPHDDALTCPTCGQAKDAWTLVADKTRTFSLPSKRKKFLCMRSESGGSPTTPEAYDAVSWAKTKVVSALSKRSARALAASGQLPAPFDLLQVRLYPGKHKDKTLRLTPLYEKAALEEVSVPQPLAMANEEGFFASRNRKES